MGIIVKETLPYLRSYQGIIGENEIAVREIDIDKFQKTRPSLAFENFELYQKLEDEGLRETNLYIK